MLNITTIENALYNWASGVTGLTVIFAHSNAPRPDSSYVTINVTQATQMGRAEYIATLKPDDSIDVDYSTVEEILVSVNTFYSGAIQTASKLKDSLARVTVTDSLYSAGLGYSRVTDIRDIPEVVDSVWEERGQFDCFFFTRSLDEENIETIKKIGVTNEIDGTTTILQ